MCGKCCHYLYAGKLKRCRYLVKTRDGKTYCKIYYRRLGKVLDILPNGHKIVCVNRDQYLYDYPDCPFNTGQIEFVVLDESNVR